MAGSTVRWRGQSQVRIGSVQFVATSVAASEDSAENFALTKDRVQVDEYVRLRAETGPWNRIVHIGRALDGSVPLIRELFQPSKLSAIGVAGGNRGKQVNLYLEARELESSVSLWDGIDTSDRDALASIIDTDHGSESLDLVIDATGQSLGAVRTAFEVLFPRLRHGGRYLVEGWDWAHHPGTPSQDRAGRRAGMPAVSNLMAELLGVIGTGRELVSEMSVRHLQVEIVRGPALIGEPFAIEAHYLNRGITFRPLL